MSPEEEFFYKLLEKTKQAFCKSPISKKQKKGWGASVCDTTIKKGQPLLAGINWGGNDDYYFQTEYPKDDKEREYPFLKTLPKYLKEFMEVEKIQDINYCNVCFFRTPSEDLLEPKDWENTIPLFEEYVRYIKPQYVIILGRTPIVMLDKHNKLQEIKREKYGDKVKFRLYKAKLFGEYKLCGLPHHNAKVQKETINKMWSVAKEYLINN